MFYFQEVKPPPENKHDHDGIHFILLHITDVMWGTVLTMRVTASTVNDAHNIRETEVIFCSQLR